MQGKVLPKPPNVTVWFDFLQAQGASLVPGGSRTILSHERVLMKLPNHLVEHMVNPMIQIHFETVLCTLHHIELKLEGGFNQNPVLLLK